MINWSRIRQFDHKQTVSWTKMVDVAASAATSDVRPKLFGSCRFTLCIFCFLAIVNIFLIRFSFSMALVCMTGTKVNGTDSGQAIEGEFDWSRSVISNLLGSFFYGYVITQIPGGWVSDRYGAKWALLFGMLSLSITSVLSPVAARWHYGALLALRVVQGLVSGFTVPAIYSIFTVWSSPEEKATLMSITFSGIPMANIINYPLSSLLCLSGVDNGWPLIFYLPGAITFVWCVAFFFLTSNTPENHPRISEEEKLYLRHHSCRNAGKNSSNKNPPLPWKSMILSVPVHVLWITHLSSAWTFYLVALNLPLFINETFNLGIVNNGLVCAIPYVGVLLMNFTGKLYDVLLKRGRWSKNALRKFFNTVGLLVPSILFCLMSVFPSPSSQILLLSLAAALKQLATSAGFFISHSDVAGPFSGVLFGITNTMGQVPGFVNPLLIDAMAPNGSKDEWQNIFYVAAVVGAIGAFLYLFFGSNDLQPWAGGVKKEKKNDSDGKQEAVIIVSVVEL